MGNYVQCANCMELIDLEEEEAFEFRDDNGFPILVCQSCESVDFASGN